MAIKSFSQKYTKRQQQRQNNHLKLKYLLPEDISENTRNRAIEVLRSIPFDMISMPVSTYKHYIDTNIDENDNRVVTVGYIKSFDIEKDEFVVMIFTNSRSVISKLSNPVMELQISETNDTLRRITKFNIMDYDEDTSDADDDAEDLTEESATDEE